MRYDWKHESNLNIKSWSLAKLSTTWLTCFFTKLTLEFGIEEMEVPHLKRISWNSVSPVEPLLKCQPPISNQLQRVW